MPATQFVVTYSKATGRIRRITVFPEPAENDGHLAAVLVGPGEANLHLPIAQLANHVELQPLVDARTGLARTGTSDLFDCFDHNGNFVCAVHADPLCGDAAPPGCTMIPTMGAVPGSSFINGVLTLPAVAIPTPQVR